jgi:valyl-tRNA synthetase
VSGAPGNDISLSEDRIDAERAFANKIWNASRLLFSKPTEGTGRPESLADRWIASRLNACAEIANRAFEQHRYHEAADTLYHFWWDEFCDWYLEFKKKESDWSYAFQVYETALRLLHPLMPFITEELWHRRGHEGSIALERYPQYDPAAVDTEAEREMALRQAEIIERRTSKIVVDRARIEKEIEQLQKVIANSARQLESEEFLRKAPEKVIASIRQKKAEYEEQLAKNRAALQSA